MPLRSILEIDVQDSKFREFSAMFDRYKQQLEAMPGEWGKVAAGTADATNAFEKLAKAHTSSSRSLVPKIETDVLKSARDLSGASAEHWRRIGIHSKTFVTNIERSTVSMLKWTQLSGVIGGVLGLGGGLYGFDRLAGAAAGARRSSMGLGVTPGQQKAFNTDYGRFVDASGLLAASATGKTDATSPQYLGMIGAGLKGDQIARENAADLSVDFLKKLPGLFPKGANDPLLGATAQARGLTSLISPEDIKRYLSASPEERSAQESAYRRDSKSFDNTPAEMSAWQNLSTQLTRAGDQIDKVFITGLAPLAGPIGKVSAAFVDMAAGFAKSPEFKKDIDDTVSGLDDLAKALNDPNSWWNQADRAVKGAEDATRDAGAATHNAIEGADKKFNSAAGSTYSWLKKNAPWATVPYWTGHEPEGSDAAAGHMGVNERRVPDAVVQTAENTKRIADAIGPMGSGMAGGGSGAAGGGGSQARLGDHARGGSHGWKGNYGQKGWWTEGRQSHAVDRLMKDAGLTEDGAKALVARWMYVESSGGPTAVNPHSGAEGIGQWLGSRKGNGSAGSFDEQISKVAGELNNGGDGSGGVAKRLLNTKGREAEGASAYERAEGYRKGVNAGTYKDNYADRVAKGMQYVHHDAASAMAGKLHAPGAAHQHLLNERLVLAAHQHRLMGQHHDFKSAVEAAKSAAGIRRALEQKDRDAHRNGARQQSSGLGLDKLQRRTGHDISIYNASGANVSTIAGPASFG